MGPRRFTGFTLIEIVVVIVILAILIAMAAALTRGVAAAQKRSLTATRMAAVDAALVQFVMQQKRLPCPADGTLPSSNSAAGAEVACVDAATGASIAPNQQNGVLPWKALGLAEADATDGWDRRLTYRVFPALAAPNGMNMSLCDPAGSGAVGALPNLCNTACVSTNLTLCTSPTNFLLNRGMQVQNLAGTVLMNPATTNPHTGAAYVLISAGESGGGAYLSSGTLAASTAGDGTLEATKNYATIAFANNAATFYIDDSLAEVNTTAHFDDIVSRPSVLAVVTKAGLGPRSH